jgi:hypothetical protein
MIWVGSFESLQSMLRKPRFTGALLELHTWVRSEIGQISPLVDRLMMLITAFRCVPCQEDFVELALRQAGRAPESSTVLCTRDTPTRVVRAITPLGRSLRPLTQSGRVVPLQSCTRPGFLCENEPSERPAQVHAISHDFLFQPLLPDSQCTFP